MNLSFKGSFPTIQDQDIVVNLPKNDLLWRYGGECKLEHPELMLWNYIANHLDIDEQPKEKYKEFVKTLLLHGKVTIFARRRWIKKAYNPDDDNLQLIRIINNVNNYSDNIVIPNPVNFEKIKETHQKYENTLRMTIETEIQVLNYIFNQMHNSMKIVLYQTEMVRIKGRYMHPGRVISAKNIITECAEKQIDMVHNLNQVLPPNHSEFIASSWTLVSGVVCLNLMGINPNGRKFDVPLKIKLLTDEYKKMSSQAELFVVYPMLLNRISKQIGKAHTENKKYSIIFENMKKFSIHESDVNPWLVPKYGSYFALLCCFGKSFSILKINEYLDIDESTIAIIKETLNAEIKNNKAIFNSGEEFQYFLIDDENNASGIPNFSKATNTKESYKTNFELYNKYSQLLEKSPPNSVQNYLFQHMVDIYFNRITKGVICSPVKTQKNVEVSFSAYNIPNLPKNTKTGNSYKKNYEIYIKYSQLLEKSLPNTTESQFFQHMVGIYSNKIINDILENPVNTKNNAETSFDISSTSHDLNKFRKRVEDEEDLDD
ncbi:hypothetical protein BB558_003054 [Smittium angustum]|uniref:Uncharacterized protein n=1 Tax=Smittium angustum TaxID=133377 RepID=A0A2U1J788_SMIAN|nr:hypothetical protein BB558_003054 [Smittium angustum]